MTRAPIFAAVLLALAACSPSGSRSGPAPTVQVTGAICRPTPVGRQMTGCYLTLTAAADDRLTAAESPAANLVQIHESRIEGGMMMMRELRDGLALPAGQAVALEPGGNHLMLLGVKEPLVAGDTVALTLTFASSAPVEVTATVGQPAAAGADAAPAAH
ncbi:MAG: copper chaperone PCu(A)C [Alphaproteobacteria bacterium]|nr:copper chaperone PCu(A)C [Alphaproteobacteria bacterium]MBU3969195.1 copper chaperone PCu(A)C [Alphaproteobacteria bacterium]MBU3973565.1 copper chaperone PCu(A)C [Alphaproteobacteria bacterium]MBU4041217.1 copper chaperone PCu(A)C [Alphaproteobacteria bacterium]MBU4135526.1 copper chaperone PCu(A)C [Alphaproteobacteria bacterium]